MATSACVEHTTRETTVKQVDKLNQLNDVYKHGVVTAVMVRKMRTKLNHIDAYERRPFTVNTI